MRTFSTSSWATPTTARSSSVWGKKSIGVPARVDEVVVLAIAVVVVSAVAEVDVVSVALVALVATVVGEAAPSPADVVVSSDDPQAAATTASDTAKTSNGRDRVI
jgi:hypothetical protein